MNAQNVVLKQLRLITGIRPSPECFQMVIPSGGRSLVSDAWNGFPNSVMGVYQPINLPTQRIQSGSKLPILFSECAESSGCVIYMYKKKHLFCPLFLFSCELPCSDQPSQVTILASGLFCSQLDVMERV